MIFRKPKARPTPIKKNPILPAIGAIAAIGGAGYLAHKYLTKKGEAAIKPTKKVKKPKKAKRAPKKIIKKKASGGAPPPGTYKFD